MADIENDLMQLSQEIKQKDYPKLYFFGGAEKYLKKFYIDKIVESLLDESSKDMNYDIITSDGYSLDRVSQSVNTLPFFAEKRIVLLQEIGVLTKGELAPIFENIPDDVLVIINEASLKKKKTDKQEVNENSLEIIDKNESKKRGTYSPVRRRNQKRISNKGDQPN